MVSASVYRQPVAPAWRIKLGSLNSEGWGSLGISAAPDFDEEIEKVARNSVHVRVAGDLRNGREFQKCASRGPLILLFFLIGRVDSANNAWPSHYVPAKRFNLAPIRSIVCEKMLIGFGIQGRDHHDAIRFPAHGRALVRIEHLHDCRFSL